MKKSTLLRSYLPDRTIGKLVTDTSFTLKTIEPPWLDNQVNESCIPEGTYIIKRDKYGRFQFYAVQNVPMRTSIEMHGGVSPSHTDGCILFGLGFTDQYNIHDPEEAMDRLLRYYKDDDWLLTIRQFNPNEYEW